MDLPLPWVHVGHARPRDFWFCMFWSIMHCMLWVHYTLYFRCPWMSKAGIGVVKSWTEQWLEPQQRQHSLLSSKLKTQTHERKWWKSKRNTIGDLKLPCVKIQEKTWAVFHSFTLGVYNKKVELYRGIDTIFIRKSLNALSLHFETEPSLNEDTFGPVYVCRRSCSSAAGSVVGAWQVIFWQTYANAFPSGLFPDMARAPGFTDCHNSWSSGLVSSIRNTCNGEASNSLGPHTMIRGQKRKENPTSYLVLSLKSLKNPCFGKVSPKPMFLSHFWQWMMF